MDKPVQPEQARELDRREEGPGAARGLPRTGLKVQDVMNPDVVTASPAENVFSAAEHMCSHKVSCVVVAEGTVVGLLTQRDLLPGIAQEQEGYGQLPVAQYMSSPVLVAPPDLPVLEAGLILESRRIKHLPVVAQRNLVGIVTQTDITRGLIYRTPLQRVGEVMSPQIATVDEETTVAGAARTMSAQNISCVVVVMRHREPVGILTQKDILLRVILTQRSATRTPVAAVMSSPLLPIPPDYSVFAASRAMEKMCIHRLVVKDARRVCGIVSQTDILHAVGRTLAEEERHHLLLMGSDIPMFLLDATGVVTYVNGAFSRLFDAKSPAETIGGILSRADFWSSPADRERLLAVLEKGRSAQLRLVAQTGAGRRQPILMLLAATRNAGGEITSWQGVTWPVTGHRAGKKTLRRRSRQSTPDKVRPGI